MQVSNAPLKLSVMKHSTNQYRSFRLVLMSAVVILSGIGCTKKFQEYNTSNLSASIDMASAYKHIAMAVYNFSGGGDPNSYQLPENMK